MLPEFCANRVESERRGQLVIRGWGEKKESGRGVSWMRVQNWGKRERAELGRGREGAARSEGVHVIHQTVKTLNCCWMVVLPVRQTYGNGDKPAVVSVRVGKSVVAQAVFSYM